MRKLQILPSLRLLMPAMAGVIVSYWFSDLLTGLTHIFGIAAGISLILMITLYFKANYTMRWLSGFIMSNLVFLLFLIIAVGQTEKYHPDHFRNKAGTTGYLAVISEAVHEKTRSVKTLIEIRKVVSNDSLHDATGKCMVYLANNEAAQSLRYGDWIYFTSIPSPVTPPMNPEQFDFRKYLARKNIYHQVYLREDQWMLVKRCETLSVKGIALKTRDFMLSQLESHGLTGNEYTVASAILLGYDDKLDADLRDAYSGTGAMHVLCVSGLHLGILYMIVVFLLSFLNKTRGLRLTRMFIILIMIWGYAVLTGFGPSVLRSAIMFTIMNTGDTLRYSKNSLNTLSAAAFLILIYDPYSLFDTGFQLSFLAVLSILLFQQPFSMLYQPKNPVLKYFWDLTAVSVAAQIGTSPVSLFYFNQFPNYFLLTNWVLIPVSFIILCLGFGFSLLFWIPALSDGLSFLLSLSIRVMNEAVLYIENLPGASAKGIVITPLELLLVYTLIATISLFLLYRKLVWINISLVSLLTGLSVNTHQAFLIQDTKLFTVYHSAKSCPVGFISRGNGFLISDSTFLADIKTYQFHIRPHHWKQEIKQPVFIEEKTAYKSDKTTLLYSEQFGIIENTTFYILNPSVENLVPDSVHHIDFLILSNNPGIDLRVWIDKLKPDLIIIGGNNSAYNEKKWKAESDSMKVKSFSVKTGGAFVFSLK